MTANPDIRYYPAKDGVWEVLDVRTPQEKARDAQLQRLREMSRKHETDVWREYLRRTKSGSR